MNSFNTILIFYTNGANLYVKINFFRTKESLSLYTALYKKCKLRLIANFIKKMATETERKFLVKGKFRHLAINKANILQAYLSNDPERTIRIRIASKKAFLTIKGKGAANSVSRSEWEFQVSLSYARQIMKICLPGKIEKTRYFIPAGKHVFEVDVFHDKNEGLIIAEIELSHENERFEKPDWLGEEVTGKPEYYNVNLIK